LITYAISLLVAAGVITGVYFGWKHNVQQQALIRFNQDQAAQVSKDNAELSRQQADMKNQLEKITAKLTAQNAALQKKTKGANDFLSSPAAKKADRPASSVIQETLRRLQ
jgi:ribosomal protein L9